MRDNALKIRRNSATVRVLNAPETDSFSFYNPDPPTLPGVPSVASFKQTYTKSGAPRTISPGSSDPTNPLAWAGQMWKATASVEFTVAHRDGKFWARGNGASAPTDFGEMGFERNGVFLNKDQHK